jgi:hypothetical protein
MVKSKTLRNEIAAFAEKEAMQVLKSLADICQNQTNPTTLRIQAAKELLPFILPRLEQIAYTGPDGEALNTIDTTFWQDLLPNAAARAILEDVIIANANRVRESRKVLAVVPTMQLEAAKDD